jgi:hypothetical protein
MAGQEDNTLLALCKQGALGLFSQNKTKKTN